jgi:hypothetical protein
MHGYTHTNISTCAGEAAVALLAAHLIVKMRRRPRWIQPELSRDTTMRFSHGNAGLGAGRLCRAPQNEWLLARRAKLG